MFSIRNRSAAAALDQDPNVHKSLTDSDSRSQRTKYNKMTKHYEAHAKHLMKRYGKISQDIASIGPCTTDRLKSLVQCVPSAPRTAALQLLPIRPGVTGCHRPIHVHAAGYSIKGPLQYRSFKHPPVL